MAVPARRAAWLLAIALAVALALGGGALVMIGGAGCATEEASRAPDGLWRIERRSCGATVADTWRVMLRGTDGRERLALDSYGYPEPRHATLDAGVLRITLAAPDGVAEVSLDAGRRPVAPLRFYQGSPRR